MKGAEPEEDGAWCGSRASQEQSSSVTAPATAAAATATATATRSDGMARVAGGCREQPPITQHHHRGIAWVGQQGRGLDREMAWVELGDPEGYDFFLTAASSTHEPRSEGCKYAVLLGLRLQALGRQPIESLLGEDKEQGVTADSSNGKTPTADGRSAAAAGEDGRTSGGSGDESVEVNLARVEGGSREQPPITQHHHPGRGGFQATGALTRPYGTLHKVMRHLQPSKLISRRVRLRGEALEALESESCLLAPAPRAQPPVADGKLVGRRSARFLTGQGHALRQRGDSDGLEASLSLLKEAVRLGQPAASSPSELDWPFLAATATRDKLPCAAHSSCEGPRPARPQSAHANLELPSAQQGSQHWYNSLTELGAALEHVGQRVAASQVYLSSCATAPSVAISGSGSGSEGSGVLGHGEGPGRRAISEGMGSGVGEKPRVVGVASGGQGGQGRAGLGVVKEAVDRSRELRLAAGLRSSNCLFKAGRYREALQVIPVVSEGRRRREFNQRSQED